MANAAALPPLPSVRAKELESRASALSKRLASTDDNNRNKDANDKNAPSEQTEIDANISDSRLEKNTQSSSEASNLAAEKHYRERLEQIESLHQKEQKVFGQLPPLDPTVTCDAIHQYLSTTSQYLNSYIADANASLEGTSHKLSVLEKQMSSLESKLESIPGLFPEDED
mmetsp:Transcript_20280/g.28998  ORF Transcript_20280/g.28998 Transcript_20280/m.28998 type:complete len:170 (+) Transcript_20280:146-655(+)